MVNLLDYSTVLGSKEHAADCLENLTMGGNSFRRSVVRALGNMVDAISPDTLALLGVLPRLAHALRARSTGTQ